jgi:hypothetical protein
MGKTITIYFSDDVLELIEHYEGKGTLINNLIREHFSNDEELLRLKVERLDKELSRERAKLDSIISERLKKLELKKQNKENNKYLIYKNNLVDKFFELWKDNKISDDTYYNNLEGDGNLEEIEKIIKSYSQVKPKE